VSQCLAADSSLLLLKNTATPPFLKALIRNSPPEQRPFYQALTGKRGLFVFLAPNLPSCWGKEVISGEMSIFRRSCGALLSSIPHQEDGSMLFGRKHLYR
jgi:hypothetical protein